MAKVYVVTRESDEESVVTAVFSDHFRAKVAEYALGGYAEELDLDPETTPGGQDWVEAGIAGCEQAIAYMKHRINDCQERGWECFGGQVVKECYEKRLSELDADLAAIRARKAFK